MATVKKFEGFDNKDDIYELIDIFDKSSLFELDISIVFPHIYGELNVKMSKSENGVKSYKDTRKDFYDSDENEEEPGLKVKMSKDKQDKEKIITAPLVGTFYAAPSPDSEPYVQVGDKITKGTVLCVIEAMKTMNEIESEFDGEITEILAKNASPVEYGQALFTVAVK